MKKLFIAATSQNDGKTTIALGLILNLRKYFSNIGFIKPIGQRYLLEEGFKVDEDSVLMEKVCNFSVPLNFSNPIAVERGFTEKYIKEPHPDVITSQILDSFERISASSDLVIIEGTGHAGVGSVFDHSNAKVAKLLDAKVLMISSGGIGRPIDEVAINKSLFDKEGAEMLGVIVNKVLKKKYDKIAELVSLGLKRLGIEELGTIPYNPVLSAPTVGQLKEEMNLTYITGKEKKNNVIEKVIVGAMEPEDAFRYIERNTLVITPGDREDIILTAIESSVIPDTNNYSIAAVLLTGGMMPSKKSLEMMKKVRIPFLMAKEDTYTVASTIYNLNIKLRAADSEKIDLVKDMVAQYVDMDRILAYV
ncbi:MAG: AAA family ATPase [Candidatus Saelkia tenebricola]|nr:AAA family ATPase [Candidatus Saelkia tenebricola]